MTDVIRRLVGELRPYKAQVALVAVTGIIYSAAYSRIALFVGEIQNSFQNNSPAELRTTALLILGLALIVALSRYFHIYTMNMISERVVNALRLRLQAKFMNLSLGFHSNYLAGSGGLMSRILNDVKVIQDGFRMIADFFREPLLAVLLLGNLFYLNWRLTLTLLIILPPILLFLRQVSRSLRKYVLSGQENLEQITSTIKESLDGVRTIQSFNLEKTMAGKLSDQSAAYLGVRSRVHSRIEVMGPVTEFVATCLILGIFFYFSIEIGKGTQTPGAVLSYVASMLMLNAPIKKLQESYVRIQETVVASRRVYTLIDDPSEIPAGKGKLFPKDWKKIVYRNVGFSYGDVANLTGINLTIHRGEQIALVGQSGSGKSTLVNLLARFHDPSSGEILIDDTPLKEFDLKELRKNMALVSQDVFLFSDTIEKNIQAGDTEGTSEKAERAARSANAFDFISRMPNGFQSRVGDRGNLLSGGEKQRISIARAIYKDAPILILDEATSALDSASEREVQSGLDQLMVGRTSLVVAHRLSTIQGADRIIVMKDGTIVEEGRHQELLDRGGHYLQFWKLQAKV